MEFSWWIVVNIMVVFLGYAMGSVGGVGGGGIFVPMLTLIIGFDAKSSTAISKYDDLVECPLEGTWSPCVCMDCILGIADPEDLFDNLLCEVLGVKLTAASYFTAVCIIAAFCGQHIIRKLIILLGRASLIIFILAFVIFLSAITLGGEGIVSMVKKIEDGDYMGFENLCSYDP